MYLSDLILLIVFVVWIGYTVYKKKVKKGESSNVDKADRIVKENKVHSPTVGCGNIEILYFYITQNDDEVQTDTEIKDAQSRLNSIIAYHKMNGDVLHITYKTITQKDRNVLMAIIEY